MDDLDDELAARFASAAGVDLLKTDVSALRRDLGNAGDMIALRLASIEQRLTALEQPVVDPWHGQLPPNAGTVIGGCDFRDDSWTTIWKALENSTYGDGNNERQVYYARNVTTGPDGLTIEARRETPAERPTERYTSGFLGSKETGTFFPAACRVAVRARIPEGHSVWPAFWLRHRDGSSTAEVDLMESFHAQVPGRTTNTLHLDGTKNVAKAHTPFAPGQFHTWAVDVRPGSGNCRFVFWLDGKPTLDYTSTKVAWLSKLTDRSRCWDLALNLAVGGNWVGNPDVPYTGKLQNGTLGAPDDGRVIDTVFPARLDIDRVGVWAL